MTGAFSSSATSMIARVMSYVAPLVLIWTTAYLCLAAWRTRVFPSTSGILTPQESRAVLSPASHLKRLIFQLLALGLGHQHDQDESENVNEAEHRYGVAQIHPGFEGGRERQHRSGD